MVTLYTKNDGDATGKKEPGMELRSPSTSSRQGRLPTAGRQRRRYLPARRLGALVAHSAEYRTQPPGGRLPTVSAKIQNLSTLCKIDRHCAALHSGFCSFSSTKAGMKRSVMTENFFAGMTQNDMKLSGESPTHSFSQFFSRNSRYNRYSRPFCVRKMKWTTFGKLTRYCNMCGGLPSGIDSLQMPLLPNKFCCLAILFTVIASPHWTLRQFGQPRIRC